MEIPSSSRNHCPPHGPGKNVGRVRNGLPASSCSVRRSVSPSSERGSLGLAQIDVEVESRQECLLVPVEHRPVDEEQSLLGARLARGLPEVAGLSSPDGGEALPLRTVGVPEDVVLDEGASRAEHHGDRRSSGPRSRCPGSAKRSASVPSKMRPKTGSSGRMLAAVRRLHLVPRDEEAASVDEPRLDAAFGELVARAGEEGTPGKGCRTVDRKRPGPRADERVGQRAEAALDLAVRQRIARDRVVGHERNRRSSVSAALQEKSLTPSGSPVLGS